MPHQRIRIIEAMVKKSVKWSPAVALVGGRQTGKSTLLRKIAAAEISFDDPAEVDRVDRSGAESLEAEPAPLLIDEAQKYPPVFDLVKLLVDRKRRPGRFLMTGSARFSSRKGIQESLTGRAVTWELLPLTCSEANEKSFKDWPRLLSSKSPLALLEKLKREAWASEKTLALQLDRGGLPGICFLRDPQSRNLALENHIRSLIERDLFLVRPLQVRPRVARDLLGYLAERQGLPANHSDWARRLGVSVPTVQRLLDALESIFIIRTHGKTYYIEDLGLSRLLGANQESSGLLTLLFSEFRAQSVYRVDAGLRFGEYRTRGGAVVPITLSGRSQALGVTVSSEKTPTSKQVESLLSFGRKNPKAFLIAAHGGSSSALLRDRVISVPAAWLV